MLLPEDVDLALSGLFFDDPNTWSFLGAGVEAGPVTLFLFVFAIWFTAQVSLLHNDVYRQSCFHEA